MKVEVIEATQYTDRSFPTALWHETYEIPPGVYEVEPWSNLPNYYHVVVPEAIVVDSYFPSNFAGCSIQPYDRERRKGEVKKIFLPFPASYEQKKPEAMKLYWLSHPTFKLVEN